MGTLNRADLELVTPEWSWNIAQRASENKDHAKKNSLAYYVLLNTWLISVNTYSRVGYLYLKASIESDGLFSVINEASEASEEFIRGEKIRSGLFSAIVEDILRSKRTDRVVPLGSSGVKTGERQLEDPAAVVLQLLRYPKRFSPVALPSVIEEGYKTFLQRERVNRAIQRHRGFQTGYRRLITGRVAMAMESLLDWDGLCDDLEELLSDPTNFSITGGVARDAKRPLCEKLRAISDSNPEAFSGVFGYMPATLPKREAELWYERGSKTIGWGNKEIYIDLMPPAWIPSYVSKCTFWRYTDVNYINTLKRSEEKRIVHVASVPKSYKTSRIIAMEDTYRQARAKAINNVIVRYLPGNIRIDDQTQNQALALMSSLDGLLATVDMSQASDSITKTAFWEIFPKRFAKLVYPYLGTHTEINGVVRVMQMMSTSGNALTFVLESLFFLAVCKAAQKFQEQVEDVQHPNLYEGEYPIPSVYGDDQIIWSDTFEYLTLFLEALGFVINVAKSYTGNSPFRESCGLDAYLGVEVSSTYFPRKPIRGSISRDGSKLQVSTEDVTYDAHGDLWENTLTSLVSLQHRIYGVSVEAALFLSSLITEAIPRMTFSTPFSATPDVWAYRDEFVKRWAPGARAVLPKGPWSPEQEAVYGRKYRMQPHQAWQSDPKVRPGSEQLLDCYKYQEFLKHGPRFSDPFLKMLGISDAPVKLAEAAALPSIEWEVREWGE